jgi:D-aspartate ligase
MRDRVVRSGQLSTAGMTQSPIEADRSVPALVFKIGQYPWHHGGVGAIRSLGRLGIPVYAVTEDRWTPAAVSRHLRDCFPWPTTGLEEPAELIEGLRDIGRRIGRPTLLVPTDEEAAVLIAEHAADLCDMFLFPRVEPTLPRRLASKRGLHELCAQWGVPTPRADFPTNPEELDAFALEARFPLVAKNLEAFERRRAPVVGGTTQIDNVAELRALARTWGDQFSVILQECLPRADAEDWITHAYCDASSSCPVMFTGVKVRSWPPHAGMTTCAYAVPNPVLAEMTARFVERIGFRGVVDLDWRYDRRDGQYKLLDFNPRVGAQFRLFETDAGIDVVRAMHMDLTGREVPRAHQVDGRRLLVENFDLPALLAYRHSGHTSPSAPATPRVTELAWIASDDLKPFFAMLTRFIPKATVALFELWRSRRQRTRAAAAAASTAVTAPLTDTACATAPE